MGMDSTTMTALFSVKRRRGVDEIPMADLTGITTPPTPEDLYQCCSEGQGVQVDIRTPPFSEEEAEGEDEGMTPNDPEGPANDCMGLCS